MEPMTDLYIQNAKKIYLAHPKYLPMLVKQVISKYVNWVLFLANHEEYFNVDAWAELNAGSGAATGLLGVQNVYWQHQPLIKTLLADYPKYGLSSLSEFLNRGGYGGVSEHYEFYQPYEFYELTIAMNFERYVQVGGLISCIRFCGGYIAEKKFRY